MSHHLRGGRGALFLALAAAFWLAPTVQARAQAADFVFLNGKVLTVDAEDRIVEAVAVRGNRILAVGGSREIKALAGANTRVIDLAGRTLIPGLIDSHIHAIRHGLTQGVEISWAEATSLKDGLNLIREAARSTAPDAWLMVVGGWHKSQFPENRSPTPAELTEAAQGHPAHVQHIYEEAVLTPAAMAALGITRDSDVPPNGKLELGPDGKPTGLITGNVPSFARLYARLPKPDFAGQVAGTKAFFSELNRLGLTGIVDAAGGGMTRVRYQPLFELWKRGGLSLRIAFRAMSQAQGNELPDLKGWKASLPPGLGDGWLKFNGFGEVVIWGMHDGDRAGLPFAPTPKAKAAFREAALWMAENKYTAEIHASSDTSARLLLDILEQVHATAPFSDLRWAIAHLDDGTPDTLRRMKALGMGYTVQDRMYFSGEEVRGRIGEQRALVSPPIKTALDLGVVISGGTDGPRAAPYNPWLSIRWILDGKSVSGARIRGATELPSRERALRMYTLNGAWMSFDEAERGSLEPGKLADLAVLAGDYMTLPIEDIAGLESVLTMVDGRVVWPADGR